MLGQPTNAEDYFNTDHLKLGLKSRAMQGAGATILANILTFTFQFSSTVILARLLTPNDFGLVAMVTTFSLVLQNFGLNGLTEAVIQKDNLTHAMMSTLFWINAAIGVGLTVLFILIAPVVAWFYNEPKLYGIAVCISFSIITGSLSVMHMAILRRNMQFRVTSAISLLAMALGIITAIVLAKLGFGYWSLVANLMIWPVITGICSWSICRWRPGIPGGIREIVPMLKFGLHTYGNFTLNYFSRNIDKLLIGWQYGGQPLGYYKKAYDLFALPANQLVAPISNVALATLSRLRNEPDTYRRYYLTAVANIAFIGMPLSAVLTLTGQDIILLVMGPQWGRAGEVFCYLGPSIGIMLVYGTQGWLHLSLGRPDRWVRWSIVECIVTGLFFAAGLPFGIAGVAVGYTVSFYALIWPCLSFAGKPIGIGATSVMYAISRHCLAALCAGFCGFAILHEPASVGSVLRSLHVFSRIIISSALCLVLYLFFTIIFHWGLGPVRQFVPIAAQMWPAGRR